MMWWNDGGGSMLLGPLFMILILAATVVLIVALVRWLDGSMPGVTSTNLAPPMPTPLEILQQRYAKGEINKDEFEERRKVLGV
jgi:putative membrane protein